jgi:cyclase
VDWAKRLVELGAGELLVTSIDHEGMKNGFEIELVKKITNTVPIPVIACGGMGRPEHIADLLSAADVSGVACASVFHYDLFSIPELKAKMVQSGIPVSLRENAA